MNTWVDYSPRQQRDMLTGLRAVQQKHESTKRHMTAEEHRRLALSVVHTVLSQRCSPVPHAQRKLIEETWVRSRRLPTQSEIAAAEEADVSQ